MMATKAQLEAENAKLKTEGPGGIPFWDRPGTDAEVVLGLVASFAILLNFFA
jgi:hypothetical protein